MKCEIDCDDDVLAGQDGHTEGAIQRRDLAAELSN